jgi:hypothetical protein
VIVMTSAPEQPEVDPAAELRQLPPRRLWREGHGVHWGGAADYLAAHEHEW